MDHDRKSVVSSFYGGRRASGDALQQDFPSPAPYADYTSHARQDSRSSFFNPNAPGRGSVELLNKQSAGYNNTTFFDGGRQEPVKGGYDEEAALRDEPFDIYADFNNQGPRYSRAAFGADNGYRYRRVNSPSLSKIETPSEATTAPVEMVTVPALGPEWQKSEMGTVIKQTQREERSERRAQKWKEWRRGERGLCGRYFTRKFTAWFLFCFAIAVGIVLAFTIPRVPDFQINQQDPLQQATGSFNQSIPVAFNRFPANFSFPGVADLQVDTQSNFLPLVIEKIHADVYDLITNRQIGVGDVGHMTFPAKQFSHLSMPLNFSYVASNDSDQTWNNWYNGCRNAAFDTNNQRPPVQFRLVLGFKITGLIGTKHTATDVTNANCPIELPQNAA
ncbi:uncharacterized protein PHACADRAFT_106737 [Phanerochaete carnosa HHB-10118-sp]|uniref:Late embryogenesis abundant protein LEA-2 subgroup domain-containing protein n=1 Tax=Phanerochaete carnosa (strain HHB-10118-sp) TaxID=650164 RepID=K5VTD8_PHACS|nr:uncharacterized protein PHACADRAFT_106737 [Phanerochaete carnosa HHB-10118-sp]EKM49804.1 hypothetical protein PHACADRAFT_106737 [Phanerochaete carnosa HHB-10118-sp]